jgi:pteridine reductase
MLTGKVVLVTGAGVRVGRAIAMACAASGAEVAVHYRTSVSEADQVVEQIRRQGGAARAFQAELTDPAAGRQLVGAIVDHFGKIDVLVNNAAVFAAHPFTDGSDEEWERVWRESWELNLLAPARLARTAAPHLRSIGGCIVNVIDVGAGKAWPSYAHYTAAKAALAHLTGTLAVALAPEVRVVGVSPGIAAFPAAMSASERAALVAKTPLRRAGTPADIGSAVAFLAASSYVTGAILPVDGGWSVSR